VVWASLKRFVDALIEVLEDGVRRGGRQLPDRLQVHTAVGRSLPLVSADAEYRARNAGMGSA
jgi:hypothetical protein